jgi:hypothetical protein
MDGVEFPVTTRELVDDDGVASFSSNARAMSAWARPSSPM